MSEITKWLEGVAALEAYFGVSLADVVVEDYRACNWELCDDGDIEMWKDGNHQFLFFTIYHDTTVITRAEFTLCFHSGWAEGNENRAAIFDNARRGMVKDE